MAPSNTANQQPLIGYSFLLYALFCLTLTFNLAQSADVIGASATAAADNLLTPPSKPKINTHDAPNFLAIKNTQEKKDRFFEFLLPSIQKQNDYLSAQRQWLISQQNNLKEEQGIESEPLAALAKQYRISFTSNHELLQKLITQVDNIPAALVLAQAANESAWGTSRFARKANNYFGQWCFSKGCGLVPQQRTADATHEVKRFDSADESVAAYFSNINRNRSYQSLWKIRSELRESGQPLTGHALAEGLTAYSSRGEAYIHELQSMIRYNKLEKFSNPPQ